MMIRFLPQQKPDQLTLLHTPRSRRQTSLPVFQNPQQKAHTSQLPGFNRLGAYRFGISQKDKPKKVYIDDAYNIMAALMRTVVPKPAEKTWPLGLIPLLAMDGDVQRYLLETCNTHAGNLSLGINREVLPTLQPQGMEIFPSRLYSELSERFKAFTANEGQEVVHPVTLWRWLMQTDPTGNLDELLKSAGLEDEKIEALRRAPRPFTPRGPNDLPTAEELKKLFDARKELPNIIKGQKRPIEQLMNAIIADVMDSRRDPDYPHQPPVRSILFGPSGVGKTFLVKKLSQLLDMPILEVNMTEYMDKMDAKKLTGSAHGYAGWDEPSFVDRVIEMNKYCELNGKKGFILLLDEIEKAHPTVRTTLMEVLGDGKLENAKQRTALFDKAYVISTANIAQTELAEAAERGDSLEQKKQIVKKAMRKAGFKPEFIGRLGKQIFFDPLDEAAFTEIRDNFIRKFVESQKQTYQYDLLVDPSLLQKIREEGFSLETGVRLLKGTVEEYVEEPALLYIGERLSNKQPVRNTRLQLAWSDTGNLVTNFTASSKPGRSRKKD